MPDSGYLLNKSPCTPEAGTPTEKRQKSWERNALGQKSFEKKVFKSGIALSF
jgi:hypothetical protein